MTTNLYRDITIRVFQGQTVTTASCRICGALSPDQTAWGARRMRREHMREEHPRGNRA